MKTQLIGRWTLSLDDKSRVVIPAVLRPRFADGCFQVYKGEKLALYPLDEWEPVVTRLRASVESASSDGLTPEQIDRLWTVYEDFSGRSQNCELDNSGRVRLRLDDFESLQGLRKVTLNGEFGWVSIYPPDYFERANTLSAAEMSATLRALGI